MKIDIIKLTPKQTKCFLERMAWMMSGKTLQQKNLELVMLECYIQGLMDAIETIEQPQSDN